ncbi:hypothetical protein E8E14_010174 [Neopestalotiopsis sp. 37M]|nr:hypothetical protein E8E14_010174 [Neopestalotiopsis sp. 37M]
MQSFLQYKRFRHAVKAQLERKQALENASEKREDEAGLVRGSFPLAPGCGVDTQRDLERGVRGEGRDYPCHPSEHLHAPHGYRPGELAEHDNESSVPRQVHQAMAATNRPQEEIEPRYQPSESDHEDKDGEGGEGSNGDGLSRQRSTSDASLAQLTTQVTEGTRLGRRLTGINVRRRNTTEGGDGNVFVVGYEGDDDPLDPHNWSFATRLKCTLILAAIGCVVGIASSIDSSAVPEAAREFGVSEVVASLGTGLFLVGFGAGALVAGPFSETVGRNPVYIGTLILYMIFIMAAGLAPNLGAWLAFRFIAGVFGATPLVCAGGSLSDLWRPMERTWSFPIFANASFTGPVLGPVIGGWIAQSPLVSWRWTEWITLIMSGLVLSIVILFQPETYPPTLLKWKAIHLRDITGEDRYRAEIEIRKESFLHRLQHALWRPFLLTAREPIIMLFALYLTVVYIVLFGFLDGYNYVFGETYGVSQGITGLCFLGIVVGIFCASFLVPVIYSWAKKDLRKIQEQGGDRLPPEFRLWFSMLGGAFAIPISLFWMGWTARPDISIWSPIIAGVLFGYGILCVFITSYQYIIDSYESYSASALASVTMIRYMASGGMIPASIPFYRNLGVAYTCTILACISAAMVPVPYVFYKYGPWIRSKSKYAITGTTNKE